MKKLLIVVILLVLLVAGVLALAVVNANSIAKRYKPDLERLASDALGSTVTLGEISVSVFPTVDLVIDEVAVESDGETLTLDSITLKVALMPLLRRTLNIKTLVIDGPNITAYLEKDGLFIAGLPREVPAEPATGGETPKPASGPSTTETDDIPIDVSLDKFVLRNANITIIDRVADTEYAITGLRIAASLSVEDNMVHLSTVDGGATILTDVELGFVGSGIVYALVGGAIEIEAVTAEALGNSFTLAGGLDPGDPDRNVRLTSERVDLASLRPIFNVFAPGLNDLALQGSAKPDLRMAWKEDGGFLATGKIVLTGAQSTVADITLDNISGTILIEADETKMSIATNDTQATIGDSPVRITLITSVDEKQAGLETLAVEAFGGKAELDTEIQLEGEMPFTSKLTVRDMEFGQLVAALLPDTPTNITGTLKTVDGDIRGTFNEDLMPSITGSIGMTLKDGLIKEVNLGKQVLGSVTEIPFLGGSLLKAVPDSLRNFLEMDHTVLESVTGNFYIAQETLTTDNLSIRSDFFSLDARGTIGFDTNLDLDATIYFTREFSAGLARTTSELKVLFDDQGRLAFPVKVSGVPPNLVVLPDVSKLVKQAVKGTVREKAGEVFKELLGGKEEKEGEKKGGLLKRLGIKR